MSPPPSIQLSQEELQGLLSQLRPLLPEALFARVESLLRVMLWILGVIEQKQITLARLRRMLFGETSEKTRKIFPPPAAPESSGQGGKPKPKRKGHGRKGAKEYPGARSIKVPHPNLRAGDLCPQCRKGKLHLFHEPAKILRLFAQPLFQAMLFELERLRCALCGALFTAPAPPEAGQGKYDQSVGVMLAVLRFGMGQPMYRIEKWQQHFGVPLAASTQWELIDAASAIPKLIYEALLDLAANGSVLYTDDTSMRVQSLRKEISEKQLARTGIFTTGILSRVGPHQIAVFITGQRHAGENIDQVLKRRLAGTAVPLHMCDGLAHNHSKEFETILCNCLCHSRRHVVKVADSFPLECRKILESLAEVYRIDAQAKEQGLSDEQRLLAHQTYSKAIVDDLHQWMQLQIDQKQVEPNSGLGQALNYMLRRWEPLTRFLTVPGAPLDNNAVERVLKMAILHRRNSLSYKTVRGAQLGDIFMSLIHTCELNQINPFDYLMALQRHADSVPKNLTAWLPWNYQATLPSLESG